MAKPIEDNNNAAAFRTALDVPTNAALNEKYTKPANGIPAADLEADPAGRLLLTATSAAERKQVLGLDQVNNTSDANKPVSTPQAQALATKMDATLPALQTVFDGGTAAQRATFQSSVSGARVIAQSAVPVSLTGTTSPTLLAEIPIPADTLGPNGALRLTVWYSRTNNANSVNVSARWGMINAQIWSANLASVAAVKYQVDVANRGATGAQLISGVGTGNSFGTLPAFGTASENTTVPQRLQIVATLGVAADTVVLERYTVELLK